MSLRLRQQLRRKFAQARIKAESFSLPHQFLALSNDSFQPFLLQLQKFGDLAALGQNRQFGQ
jgi:hypothetical protein